MRSFLVLMNESGADQLQRVSSGGIESRSRAAELIDLSESERGEINRLDYIHLLFEVLDQLTFYLWDLPDTVDDNEITVTLPQYGTDATFDVTFRRIDDHWRIVGPPIKELQQKRDELIAARGEYLWMSTPEDLKTPRDAFKLFLWGVSTYGYTRDNPAYKTLDTSELTPTVREQETSLLAAYLRQVLDRIGYILWQEIPNDPNSRTPYVHFEHQEGSITVAPVDTGNGVIWQFTPDTLSSIRSLYAAMDEMPREAVYDFAEDKPVYFRIRTMVRSSAPALLSPLGPLERWQWGALAVMVLVGWSVGYGGNVATVRVFRSRAATRAGSLESPLARVLTWSVPAITFGFFLLVALYALGLPEIVATPVKAFAWIIIIVAALPIGWHLIGLAAERYRRRWETPGYHDTLITLMAGVIRVVLLIVGFLLLADVLAIPYEGVIAGLGIGGLAVALAAQPTLHNFLSGLTLYADRPVSVGDFCRFGDKLGTVERIGMRSTSIRSLDRTVITIPNSEFANLQLENYTRRDNIRFVTTLQLRFETTPDQMRYVLAELRRLLIAHPRVTPDPCRVRFMGVGEYAFDIEIFAYINTTDYNEFLAIQEDLYLRMMVVIEEAGTAFAFPSHVEYRTEDRGLDTERIKESEEKVTNWRSDHRLPFPDFDEHEKIDLANTLDYPPKSSVVAPRA